MQVNYPAFAARMIKRYEGGYVFDSADPGGPTKYGITAQALADHRGQKMNSFNAWVPAVKAMTIEEAGLIYEKKYAKAVRFAEMPSGVDCVLFDYGVNSGPGRAVRVVRSLCGLPSGTIMTKDVVEAILKRDPKAIINSVCDERLRFMQSLKGGAMWKRYGKGWGSRVADLRKYSLALATGVPLAASTAPDLTKVSTPKAEEVGGKAPGTTITSTVLAGGGAWFADFQWWWIVVAVLAVVAIGVGYEAWQDIKAKKANEKVHT